VCHQVSDALYIVFIFIHKVFVVKYQTEICRNLNFSSNPKPQRKATNNRLEDSGIEPNTQHGEHVHMFARFSGR
jgi:hypothetical protein